MGHVDGFSLLSLEMIGMNTTIARDFVPARFDDPAFTEAMLPGLAVDPNRGANGAGVIDNKMSFVVGRRHRSGGEEVSPSEDEWVTRCRSRGIYEAREELLLVNDGAEDRQKGEQKDKEDCA